MTNCEVRMTRAGTGHKPVARCPMTNAEIRMTAVPWKARMMAWKRRPSQRAHALQSFSVGASIPLTPGPSPRSGARGDRFFWFPSPLARGGARGARFLVEANATHQRLGSREFFRIGLGESIVAAWGSVILGAGVH